MHTRHVLEFGTGGSKWFTIGVARSDWCAEVDSLLTVIRDIVAPGVDVYCIEDGSQPLPRPLHSRPLVVHASKLHALSTSFSIIRSAVEYKIRAGNGANARRMMAVTLLLVCFEGYGLNKHTIRGMDSEFLTAWRVVSTLRYTSGTNAVRAFFEFADVRDVSGYCAVLRVNTQFNISPSTPLITTNDLDMLRGPSITVRGDHNSVAGRLLASLASPNAVDSIHDDTGAMYGYHVYTPERLIPIIVRRTFDLIAVTDDNSTDALGRPLD